MSLHCHACHLDLSPEDDVVVARRLELSVTQTSDQRIPVGPKLLFHRDHGPANGRAFVVVATGSLREVSRAG